jgi:hypothetical protein
MDKLTINELKWYLGTGLKFYDIYSEQIFGEIEKIDLHLGEITLFKSMSTIQAKIDYVNQLEHNYKPLLYPLSSLTEYREDLGFVPIDNIKESQRHLFFREDLENPINGLDYSEMQKLLSWNFDCFNLIYRNLAINIKTLKDE